MATTVTTSFKDCVITVTHKIFFENYNNGFTADQFAAKKKAIKKRSVKTAKKTSRKSAR